MEYKIIPIDKLVEFNRRDLRQSVIKKLRERLQKEYNPARPLTVVQRNGHFVVADGNHRLFVLRDLDIKEVPCVIREGNEYTIAIQSNQDEETYAPEDLFDRLDTIRQLKDQGHTQAEIGDVMGVSRSAVNDHNTIINKIDAQVLDLCRKHQDGRAPENDANASSFNFTEGWFRRSGVYEHIPINGGNYSVTSSDALNIKERKVDHVFCMNLSQYRESKKEELNRPYYRAQMELIKNVLSRSKEKDKRFGQIEKTVTNAWVKKESEKLGWFADCSIYIFQVLDKKVKTSDKKALIREIRNGVYGEKKNDSGVKKLDEACKRLNEKALGIVLYNDDAFFRIPKLQDKSISLVVTDPPYNTTEYEWDKIGSRKEFLEFTENWLKTLKPKLADNYHIFFFCDTDYQAEIEGILVDNNWPILSRIIWANRSLPAGRNIEDKFVRTYQMIYHIGNHKLNWPPDWDDSRFDVQIIAAPNSNTKDGGFHVTPKPEKLLVHFIKLGSTIGDTILDLFAGGGSTGAASIIVGQRQCILIEKEDKFCDTIEYRLNIKRESDGR